jgi:large subunit ribosomal protein L18
MTEKKSARLRRAYRTRSQIKTLKACRLSVHKTSCHIYAQVISPDQTRVLVSASSLDKKFRESNIYGGNIAAASEIGKMVAERAKAVGISKVSFDRSGFKYHGRIKALADAARQNGLVF